jgi:hypothetical protein
MLLEKYCVSALKFSSMDVLSFSIPVLNSFHRVKKLVKLHLSSAG